MYLKQMHYLQMKKLINKYIVNQNKLHKTLICTQADNMQINWFQLDPVG